MTSKGQSKSFVIIKCSRGTGGYPLWKTFAVACPAKKTCVLTSHLLDGKNRRGMPTPQTIGS